MRLRRLHRAVWLVAASLPSLVLAQAPDCRSPTVGAARAESARYTILYRTVPAKLTVSSHFSLDIAVCPKSADAPVVQGIAVDALMPAHGHGMNYKAAVKALGDGRYRADGLMFHMPGRWRLVFDVRSGETAERITHDIGL